MRRTMRSLGLLVSLVVVVGCSGGSNDAAAQAEMKEGFTNRPARDQLPPAQQQRYDAMKKMADDLAKQGNGGK